MPCVHEFGIIDEIDEVKDYSKYSPEKYHCVAVEDDTIQLLVASLASMKTYFHSLQRRECGLAYWGVTIIPPESLPQFYDVVESHHSKGLEKLSTKIKQALEENKYMIHFGI